MHYRFWFFPSFYRKREPEILFDGPTRINPGENLPITFTVKDAHHYPITLHTLTIYTSNKVNLYTESFDTLIDSHFYYKIISINRDILSQYEERYLELYAEAVISIKGKKRRVLIHNLKQLSHPPLKIYLSQNKLPGSDSYLWGDMHIHSNYTDNQIEFGASVESIATTAKAFGIDFQPITDHSFDLDDEIGYFYKPSQTLIRWTKLKEDIQKYSDEKLVLIRGEEISAGNKKGQNVHFLAYDHDTFVAGRGDSGEIWFNYHPTYSVEEVINLLPDSTLKIAAHPFEHFPKSQRYLLNRGIWDSEQSDEIDGLQILNSTLKNGFHKGKKIWINNLLKGKKQFIYGGSDAHGNFNAYRQISLPPFTLQEGHCYLYGSGRSGVISSKNKNDILQNLKSGKSIVTNSYAITLEVMNEKGELFQLGESAQGLEFSVNASFLSTEEFGPIGEIKLILGDITSKTEHILFSKELNKLEYHHKAKINGNFSNAYLRAEAKGKNEIALTNPIWFSKI